MVAWKVVGFVAAAAEAAGFAAGVVAGVAGVACACAWMRDESAMLVRGKTKKVGE